MGLASAAAHFTDQGIVQDDEKFRQSGIDGFSAAALPYYARWVRQDLVGIYFILNRVARYALLNAILLALIAVPLWVIALR